MGLLFYFLTLILVLHFVLAEAMKLGKPVAPSLSKVCINNYK
jgi:hypothetical protein